MLSSRRATSPSPPPRWQRLVPLRAGAKYRPDFRRTALVMMLLAALLSACTRPAKVPGETDIQLTDVRLQAPDDAELQLAYAPLMDRLGMRKASLILPARYYSEFRENEDRRRIEAFWQTYGYFDVVVDPPATVIDEAAQTATIAWTIRENRRYTIGSVKMLHAPEPQDSALRAMIPFAKDSRDVDLESYRKIRVKMAEHLRDEGYGHAMVYSRAFVDRDAKQIHWYYYVDAGPETRVGKVIVDGNVKIPDEVIRERVGMHPGDPYDYATKLQREFDLIDSGAFASAFVRTTADTVFLVPGDAPDTGGILRPEQVDENGDLIPRELSEELDLTIHVTEAPSQQLRLRAGAEIDPTRFDTTLSGRLWLRNLFGPLHHVTLEGHVGYGWTFQDGGDDPAGVYGEATLRYLKPMLFGRLGDFRITGRFRDELFPGFHLREVTAGPGVRSTFAKNVFFDFDVLFRYAEQLGFGPFDDDVREAFSLPSDDTSIGVEAQTSLVWDARDNPVEALRGHLLGMRASFNPGDPIGRHRYLTLAPDLRGFLPIGDSMAIGVRASGGWAFLGGDAGVPLGPRMFGGGAYGMRGFGRYQLSPRAPTCVRDGQGALLACQGVPVGGLSLAEASLEARWLPPLKPYGAVVFGDLGGAGKAANPFDDGVSLALGLGLRLRLWYLPAAIDVGYRLLRDSSIQALEDDPLLLFFRLGEAF